MLMTAVVVSASALMLWMGGTVLLLSCLWVLPSLFVVLPGFRPNWVWGFLRGDQGVGGTLRIGLTLAGGVWWLLAAGFSLPPALLDALFLVGGLVLVALFNASRHLAMSVVEELVLCALLSAVCVSGLLLLLYLFTRS